MRNRQNWHWAIPALLAVALAVSIPFELRAERAAGFSAQGVQTYVDGGKLIVDDTSHDGSLTSFYYSVDDVLLGTIGAGSARPTSVAVPPGRVLVQAVRDGRPIASCWPSAPERASPSPCPAEPPSVGAAEIPPSPAAPNPALPVLERRVLAHLRYTNPSIEVDVSLPLDDPVGMALRDQSLPLAGFLAYALSRATLVAPSAAAAPNQIAYAFPLRAQQIYVNGNALVVHAETSEASVQNSGLAGILPVLEREVSYAVDPSIDAYLRARYRIEEEYAFTMDEFRVVRSNAPNYVIGKMTGEHLVWERRPGQPDFLFDIRYPYLASFANFAKLAGNGPSDYWPQARSLLDDGLWLVRMMVFLVFAAIVFGRPLVAGAAPIPLAVGLVPVLVALDPNRASTAWLAAGVAVAGIALVALAVLRRMSSFALPTAVGGVTLALAATVPLVVRAPIFLPSTLPYFVLCAFTGAFLASALVTFFGVLAGGLRAAIAVPVVVVAAVVTVPLQPLAEPVWTIVMWSRPLLQDALHDSSTWMVWASFVTALAALGVYVAGRNARSDDTRRAGFLFCLTFVDAAIWWGIVVPIEVLGAALVFRFVWLHAKQRAAADAAVRGVVADRAFLSRQRAQWDVRAVRSALDALAARFRKSEVSAAEYETGTRSLEGYARLRQGNDEPGMQPLAIGPDANDVANGRVAAWIGLAFGLVDFALGVPAIVRAFADGTPRSFIVGDVVFQTLSGLAFFVLSSFVFGYFFRFWRGSTGLFKGLLIGALLVPVAACGWYSRGVTPLQLGLYSAEMLAQYATIGLVFDYRSLKAALGWRFQWIDVFRHAGGPELATVVAALAATLGLGILEALRGEFSTLAKAAFTVSTGAGGGHG